MEARNLAIVTKDQTTQAKAQRGKGIVPEFGIYAAPKSRTVFPSAFKGSVGDKPLFAVYTKGTNPYTKEVRAFIYFREDGAEFKIGDKVSFIRVPLGTFEAGARVIIDPAQPAAEAAQTEAPVEPEKPKAARRSRK